MTARKYRTLCCPECDSEEIVEVTRVTRTQIVRGVWVDDVGEIQETDGSTEVNHEGEWDSGVYQCLGCGEERSWLEDFLPEPAVVPGHPGDDPGVV